MKLRLLILYLLPLVLVSCEERTGYYNGSQNEILENLTGTRWLMTAYNESGSDPSSGSTVYTFELNGRGSIAYTRKGNGDLPDETTHEYFQWTFTNDTFSVIVINNYSNTFWLIDRLTSDELCVTSSPQDPVLYPNAIKSTIQFRATND